MGYVELESFQLTCGPAKLTIWISSHRLHLHVLHPRFRARFIPSNAEEAPSFPRAGTGKHGFNEREQYGGR